MLRVTVTHTVFLQTKNEIIEAAAKTNRLIKNKKGNRKKEV